MKQWQWMYHNMLCSYYICICKSYKLNTFTSILHLVNFVHFQPHEKVLHLDSQQTASESSFWILASKTCLCLSRCSVCYSQVLEQKTSWRSETKVWCSITVTEMSLLESKDFPGLVKSRNALQSTFTVAFFFYERSLKLQVEPAAESEWNKLRTAKKAAHDSDSLVPLPKLCTNQLSGFCIISLE